MKTALSVLLIALTSMAGALGAVPTDGVTDWLIAAGQEPRELRHIAPFTPDGDEIIGADPLVYDLGYPYPFIKIPPGPAEVVALIEPSEGRTALAALIFHDGTPVCGKKVGSIWVDSGTAAFLTRDTAEKLAAMRAEFGAHNQNLYDDYFAAPHQMGESAFARMLTLPDGTAFPGFSSGWGDGGYPVVTLYDDQGQLLALYADFMGTEKIDNYILPPPCADAGT
ncbi:MAG: DUF4241 domain-containing protein [Paracoccus sp. (in: a-proteobacteria)]